MFWVNYMYFNQNIRTFLLLFVLIERLFMLKNTCIVYKSANVFISGIKKLFR